MTSPDNEILRSLTRYVRVITAGQADRELWPGSRNRQVIVRAHLKHLQQRGLVMLERAPVHPELPVTGPLYIWRVGDEPPDFGALSYSLRSRWSQPPQMTWLVSASKAASNLLSGHGGRL